MEHAQPLHRPFPWRLVALVASAAALVALAVGVLAHHSGRTAPATASGRVSAGRAVPPPLRPRSHISVLVLNGNGVSGAAGTVATSILARGYQHAIPTDAPLSDYPRSLVLFRPGWQGEGERLAKDAGIRTVATLDGRVAPAYAHVPLVLILGAN